MKTSRSKNAVENIITEAMHGVGYRRIGKLVYLAEWSSEEVQHAIFYDVQGVSYPLIFGGFCPRNADAEQFGLRCIRKYGGEIYRNLEIRSGEFFHMRASIGMMADWWPRYGLEISRESIDKSTSIIVNDIHNIVIPISRKIRRYGDLINILLSDDEPFQWFKCNSAIRAANIAFLLLRTGKSEKEIESILSGYIDIIKREFLDISADSYIRKIIMDAREVVC